MIDPRVIERLARNIARYGTTDGTSAEYTLHHCEGLRGQLDLDLQDFTTLLRLATGESMIPVTVTQATAPPRSTLLGPLFASNG